MDACVSFSEVFHGYAKGISYILGEYTKVLYELNKDLDNKLDLLCDSFRYVREQRKKVQVIGAGKSALVGACFALRLGNFGFDVSYIGDVVKKRIEEGDLCLCYSGSGDTRDVVINADVAKDSKAKIKVFTTYLDSPLAALVDSPTDIFVLPGGLRKGKEWEYIPAQIGALKMPENSENYHELFGEATDAIYKIKDNFYLGGGFETFAFVTNEMISSALGEYFGIGQKDAASKHFQDQMKRTV